MTDLISAPHSRLFYYGTTDEVQLGDRIRVKRWIRKDLLATVCYPGISPRHPVLEGDDVSEWAFQADSGEVRIVAYLPEHLQPPRKMELIARGEPRSIPSDADLK